ncbi:MAG: DNA primase DnaG [Thermofilaceae archaeon]
MVGVPVNAKYVIHAKMEVEGLVDKSDIIGALFGQTEGLLGSDLDLRELQNNGRIGRIEVTTSKADNKMRGIVKVPSNLSKIETALIAAALETIDRVGPYAAKVEVIRIEDIRAEKRKRIVERAKELLRTMEEEAPESRELIEEIAESLKIAEIVHYGPEGLPAGPEIDTSDTVIVVEGRADVINLLKHGYKNVIALGGATIPKTIAELAKKKKLILFVDGDRGGELIARNVISAVNIESIARAPPGREVEELAGKEIAKALKNKMSVKEFLESIKPVEKTEEVSAAKVEQALVQPRAVEEFQLPPHVVSEAKELRGTLEAILYDPEWKFIKRIPVRDLVKEIGETENASYVVFDGIITQRLIDTSAAKGVKALIGARIGDVLRIPDGLILKTLDDIIKLQ